MKRADGIHYAGRTVGVIMVMTAMALALAQMQPPEVDPIAPGTWFTSVEALIIAVSILFGWVTKLVTAFGKDVWLTEGNRTVILSGVVAVIVGGVGGYFAMGIFADLGGWQGAINAAFIALWAFIQSNAKAKDERHVAEAVAVKTAAANKILVDETEATAAKALSIGHIPLEAHSLHAASPQPRNAVAFAQDAPAGTTNLRTASQFIIEELSNIPQINQENYPHALEAVYPLLAKFGMALITPDMRVEIQSQILQALRGVGILKGQHIGGGQA